MTQWGVRFEVSRVGSHRRHNHPRQIFCQSVQGFGSSDPQNFAISIGLASRPDNSVSNAVLHCGVQVTFMQALKYSQGKVVAANHVALPGGETAAYHT